MAEPTPRRNKVVRDGGAAVSSGTTSPFGVPILPDVGPSPADSAGFDGLDLPTEPKRVAKRAVRPSPHAIEPDAAMFDGLDLPSTDAGRRDGSVVGSITELIRRCRDWFADGEKPRRRTAETTTRTRAAAQRQPAEPRVQAPRERAVHDAARNLAEATAALPRPLPKDPRERIIEKRRLMLELKRQRDRESRDEVGDITIIRRPPPNRPPGA